MLIVQSIYIYWCYLEAVGHIIIVSSGGDIRHLWK